MGAPTSPSNLICCEDFTVAEFESLRVEVKETKARMFRLSGIAFVGAPSTYFAAQVYDVGFLTLFLPILIAILLTTYMAESAALMRCGEYIRTAIEPRVERPEGIRGGWETWLEQERRHRRHDRMNSFNHYAVFALLFLASVFVAMNLLSQEYSREHFIGGAIIYTVLGTGCAYLMYFYWPVTTRTTPDRPPSERKARNANTRHPRRG